jgi:Ca2+-binding RTX toxin-like protein
MAVITATRINDTITGTSGDDSIVGSRLGDLIDGGGGADTIDGGMTNIEVPNGTDTIHGGAGDDSITGNSGGLMYGEDGNDSMIAITDAGTLMEGGAGNDRLDGLVSVGSTTGASYLSALSGVHVSLDISAPQDVGGGMGIDTLLHMASVTGSAFNDTLTALSQTTLSLAGGSGLAGEGGDDLLIGGLAADNFAPGAGNDTILGGAGQDILIYGDDGLGTTVTGGLTVDLRIVGPQTIGGGMGIDSLDSIERVSAGRFGDTLTGADTDNQLFGQDGDDSLSGMGGNDLLDAGRGNDSLSGGNGNDSLTSFGGHNVLRGDGGDDKITAGVDNDFGFDFDDANGNTGNDTLTDQFAKTIDPDWLRGGRGDDSIVGGLGADFISGDRGNDTETGGLGPDRFHTSQDAGIDRVLDFSVAEGDRVMLDPGTTFTVSQVGADTVIDMGAGNQMILVGVSMSSLTASSIFLG